MDAATYISFPIGTYSYRIVVEGAIVRFYKDSQIILSVNLNLDMVFHDPNSSTQFKFSKAFETEDLEQLEDIYADLEASMAELSNLIEGQQRNP